MNNLRSQRLILRISQSRLARISGVSRFKICLYELGDGSLTQDELGQIREALHSEVERLRGISAKMDFDRPPSFGVDQ